MISMRKSLTNKERGDICPQELSLYAERLT